MESGAVDAVVVGADRVVANGDTANKIGTYCHAVAAAAHGLPFFIAAPTTTLDAALPTGAHIVIEQRPSDEITHFRGQRVVVDGIDVRQREGGCCVFCCRQLAPAFKTSSCSQRCTPSRARPPPFPATATPGPQPLL